MKELFTLRFGGTVILLLLLFQFADWAIYAVTRPSEKPQIVWEGTEYRSVYFAPDGDDGAIHMTFIVNDSVGAVTWDGAIVRAFQEAGFQKREPIEGARIIVYDNSRMKVIIPEN